MRTNACLIAVLTLGSITAAPTRGHAQVAAKPSVPVSAPARSAFLHEQAVGLHTRPPRFTDAARLHVASAHLRGNDDPQAVKCLALAAHLYSHADRQLDARRAMVQAAERALAMGDVVAAARAFTDAALLAEKEGNKAETERLGRKALTLASSPLLQPEERSRILSRIRSKAARAEGIVVIDGHPVEPGADNLLQALRGVIPPSRLGLTSRDPNDEPLLVVDGVRLIGTVRTLAGLRAAEVKRVTTLRGTDAYTRFGPDAEKGVIIVETRTGARR